ncbi:hypothetical protein HIM_02230 [Hirsutella minnesotensis 3608]|nr:hypothetical protein HIM_02230 [Hirsutella minnesotensis 3608]
MKDQSTVIEEFNELVNMTPSELETWLKSDDSQSAGWPKDEGSGESVGHDSGHKIIEILKANPDKDPEKYTEEQISHMRKVASYCKRHLAQEEKTNDEKSVEEVKKTKSNASLKNWGHDVLKKRQGGQEAKSGDKEEGSGDQQQTGEKRKAETKETGPNKKRETEKGKSSGSDIEEENNEADEEKKDEEESKANGSKSNGSTANGDESKSNGSKTNGSTTNGSKKKDDEKEEKIEDAEEESKDEGKEGGDDDGSGKPKKGPNVGDTVSWNWGNGQPEGKVLDVKGEKTSIETKRGNEVSRKGDPEDPAVVLDTGGSKAIKSAHELNEVA